MAFPLTRPREYPDLENQISAQTTQRSAATLAPDILFLFNQYFTSPRLEKPPQSPHPEPSFAPPFPADIAITITMPLFGSRSSDPAVSNHNGHHNNTTTTTTTQRSTGLGHGLFHRSSAEDPSISAARSRVATAEQAERDADRALQQARVAVREARDGVKRLEREAAEE
ncbi:hypothetical protein MMC19_006375 [Ptychographa xylographoides]|nr:hypothetical protein [Ptychographa xylographoides]